MKLFRRLAIVLGFAAILAVVAAVSAPYLVNPQSFGKALGDQVLALAGRELAFDGKLRLALLPLPGIEIQNAVLRDASGKGGEPPLLRVEQLRARLHLLPLLRGNLEFGGFELFRPQLNLKVNSDGELNWRTAEGRFGAMLDQAATIRTAATAGTSPEPVNIEALTIGNFTISDGSAYYENLQTGRRETITGISGKLHWPQSSTPLDWDGSGVWRGENFRVAVRSPEPLELFSSTNGSLSASIRSSVLDFTFQGDANFISSLHLSGSGSLEAKTLRRVSSLFGGALGPGTTLSDFSVSGQIEATAQKLAFSEAEIALDGNAGQGTLQISGGEFGRPRIDGTIAAGKLDLAAYLPPLTDGSPPKFGSIALLEGIDLDLRISAGSMALGALELRDLAATLTMSDREANIEIGNASLFDGLLTGQVLVARDGAGSAFLSSLRLMGFDAASLFASRPKATISLTGQTDIQADLKGSGKTAADAINDAIGEAKINASNGTISGIDLLQLYAGASANPQNADLPGFSGETAFRELEAVIGFSREKANIANLTVSNSQLIAELSGEANLAGGGVALQLDLKPGPAAPASPQEAQTVQLLIGGSLASPLITRVRTGGAQQ